MLQRVETNNAANSQSERLKVSKLVDLDELKRKKKIKRLEAKIRSLSVVPQNSSGEKNKQVDHKKLKRKDKIELLKVQLQSANSLPENLSRETEVSNDHQNNPRASNGSSLSLSQLTTATSTVVHCWKLYFQIEQEGYGQPGSRFNVVIVMVIP